MDQNKKDKFQFVKKETNTFLLEEDETTVQEAEKSEEPKRKAKSIPKKRKETTSQEDSAFDYRNGNHVHYIGHSFVFGLLWQDAYDMLAICNSLWLVFALEFTMGWSLFVYNKNIFPADSRHKNFRFDVNRQKTEKKLLRIYDVYKRKSCSDVLLSSDLNFRTCHPYSRCNPDANANLRDG